MTTPTPVSPPGREAPAIRWLRYGGIGAVVLGVVLIALRPSFPWLGVALLVAAMAAWVALMVDHIRQRRRTRSGG